MSLGDCVDLAKFLIHTTIDTLRFSLGVIRGCGGPVDVTTITAQAGLSFVQRKEPDSSGWTLSLHADRAKLTVEMDVPADPARVATYSLPSLGVA
jgi:hypothetical protein